MRKTERFNAKTNTFEEISWKDLRIGDIVKVLNYYLIN